MTSRPDRVAIVVPTASAGGPWGADFVRSTVLTPGEVTAVLGAESPGWGCVVVAAMPDASTLAAAVVGVCSAVPGPLLVLVAADQPGAEELAVPPGLVALGAAPVSRRWCRVLGRGVDAPSWLDLQPELPPGALDGDVPAEVLPHAVRLAERVAAAEAERDELAGQVRETQAERDAARAEAADLRAQLARRLGAPTARLVQVVRGRRTAAGALAVVVVAGISVLSGWAAGDVAAGLVAGLLLVAVPALGYLVAGVRRVGRAVGRVDERVQRLEQAASAERVEVRKRLDGLQRASREAAERDERLAATAALIAVSGRDTSRALGELLPRPRPAGPRAGAS